MTSKTVHSQFGPVELDDTQKQLGRPTPKLTTDSSMIDFA